MRRSPLWLLFALLAFAPQAARAACDPIPPVACDNCFAVFVMPDTQSYLYLFG